MRVYEGEEALAAFFKHVADTKPKEYLEISNLDDVFAHLDPAVIISARKAHPWEGIKIGRSISQGTPKAPRRANSEIHTLANTWGNLHGNIAIYEDYVSFITFTGKLVVVIIESKTLAESMRVLFNVTWEISK